MTSTDTTRGRLGPAKLELSAALAGQRMSPLALATAPETQPATSRPGDDQPPPGGDQP